MTYDLPPPAPEFVTRHFPGLIGHPVFDVDPWQWLALGGALILALGVGRLISHLSLGLTRLLSKHDRSPWIADLVRATQWPLTMLLALAAFDASSHGIDPVGRVSVGIDQLSRQLLIAGLSWLLIVGAGSLTRTLERRLLGRDEYSSRGLRTQLTLAHRVVSAAIVLVGAALILSSFQAVRHIGVSLLASAGIASVLIGFAAQKTLGSFFSGFQVSITQPIRIGDTIVIDSEFGTVEEIRLTYVVIRTWDLRRLVVPVSKFIDQTFQNWTRVKTHLLGTVELWVDYTTPVEPLRAELRRICHASHRWDQKTCALQVTDASDHALKLRALVSAIDSSTLFDLRCEVREQLVAFLNQLDGGLHLPFSRNANLPDDWQPRPSPPAVPAATPEPS